MRPNGTILSFKRPPHIFNRVWQEVLAQRLSSSSESDDFIHDEALWPQWQGSDTALASLANCTSSTDSSSDAEDANTEESERDEAVHDLGHSNDQQGVAPPSDLSVCWRVRNTFLEYSDSKHRAEEGCGKRCLSADDVRAGASKRHIFVPCPAFDKVQQSGLSQEHERDEAVDDLGHSNDQQGAAPPSDLSVYCRVRNTFLEYSGSKHRAEEGCGKRCLSADDIHAGASKRHIFVPCPAFEKVQQSGLSQAASSASSPNRESAESPEKSEDLAQVTSIMVRNIACGLTQEDIAGILDDGGFQDMYASIYTPRRHRASRNSNLGFTFITFKTAEVVHRFRELFDGKCFGPVLSDKSSGSGSAPGSPAGVVSDKLCAVVPANTQGRPYGPKRARAGVLRMP